LRGVIFSFSLLCAVLIASNVQGGVVERVKTEGALRCGSAKRPGLAEPNLFAPTESGQWQGLNVEMCRAIAIAVLGPAGRFEFHRYETQKDYDVVSQGTDAVFFLTASEIIAQNLTGKLIPGPAVYYETHALMVKADSAAHRLEDLRGARICFVTGDGAQRSLESFFEARQLPFFRLAFSEEDEMRDAYRAGRCDAVAEEETALAKMRLQEGVKADRILPQPLAVFPVLACTTADGKWAAIVAWTIHTLLRADIREGSWRADGAKALPIDGTDLGLDQDWQKRLIDTLGAYGDIYRRTLGDQSVYGLARGLNAPSIEGGLFLAPYVE
jgi:general L-amino acid transport system substrate-binding protein